MKEKIFCIGSKEAGDKNDVRLLTQSLKAHGLTAEIEFYYWEDLVFRIGKSTDKLKVSDAVTGQDMAEAQLVLALNWYRSGASSFYRDMALTLALYLQETGTAFWNGEMIAQRSTTKLSALAQLAQHGIPVPKTVFSLNHQVLMSEETGITFPMVVKTIAGSRGTKNHLVRDKDELRELLTNDANIPYMLEEYVPNDYDLRVICYGGEPALVIKRSRTSDKTHLNNTSQGATANLLPLTEIDGAILQACREACRLLEREMGGVDVIIANDGSKRMVCLEVNAIPQLTSGSYTSEKAACLVSVINEYVKGKV